MQLLDVFSHDIRFTTNIRIHVINIYKQYIHVHQKIGNIDRDKAAYDSNELFVFFSGILRETDQPVENRSRGYNERTYHSHQ